MPIYEYAVEGECLAEPCCAGGFEVFAKISDPELTHCPRCGALVKRVLSASSNQMGSKHLMQEKNFSSKGFTQYRKAGNGVYEKTAGNGPQYLSGKDE